jgi:hypothetical protein
MLGGRGQQGNLPGPGPGLRLDKGGRDNDAQRAAIVLRPGKLEVAAKNSTSNTYVVRVFSNSEGPALGSVTRSGPGLLLLGLTVAKVVRINLVLREVNNGSHLPQLLLARAHSSQ